jgi:4-hydroxybenzoate polyprenyltransferase
MTQDQRNYVSMTRLTHYFDIMRTTIFAFVGLGAIIELGPDGYSAPLTVMVIATAAYGILAGGTTLDDIINLRADMDEETANTSYGKALKARNIPALKMTSSVLLGLIAVAELYAIFTASVGLE